jgi:hypothetical protein
MSWVIWSMTREQAGQPDDRGGTCGRVVVLVTHGGVVGEHGVV